ncbi:hypothetical protein [Pseudomonas syringae]|uniref:hypothetical protein n=1 Tax=Pseudomonas syringae TaxID=317 RepID=UPI00320467B5
MKASHPEKESGLPSLQAVLVMRSNWWHPVNAQQSIILELLPSNNHSEKCSPQSDRMFSNAYKQEMAWH